MKSGKPSVGSPLQIGFTRSPHDLFMIHGLLHGLVDQRALGTVQSYLAEADLLDSRAMDPTVSLPVTRLNAAAMARVLDRYGVMPCGATLGYGIGPLVCGPAGGSDGETLDSLAGGRIAVPGDHSTAALLLRLFGPKQLELVPTQGDGIVAAVAAGKVDAGVVLHAERYSVPSDDVAVVADLGELWEDATSLPLPLEVLCVRRDVVDSVSDALASAVQASIRTGFDRPQASWEFIRAHNQHMDEEVCRRQVHLHVNDHSLDLEASGRSALEELLARGREAGLLPPGPSPWR